MTSLMDDPKFRKTTLFPAKTETKKFKIRLFSLLVLEKNVSAQDHGHFKV